MPCFLWFRLAESGEGGRRGAIFCLFESFHKKTHTHTQGICVCIRSNFSESFEEAEMAPLLPPPTENRLAESGTRASFGGVPSKSGVGCPKCPKIDWLEVVASACFVV